MLLSLANLPVGAQGRCARLCTDCPVSFKKKLLAIGIIPGSMIAVIRIAPLGCPFEIEVCGSRYFLRRSEAACIFIENLS
jgi:ferrous iron transport protein A